MSQAGSIQTSGSAAIAAPPAVAKTSHFLSGDGGFSFGDLLDVVNPLQHIPVIGTLYRAITGDTIGTVERVAGDALYGGIWGAVASIADAAFAAVTGKDMGDTVLALFHGGGRASPAPQLAKADAAAALAPPSAAMTALEDALLARGVHNDLARRALFAYKKSMELPALALNN